MIHMFPYMFAAAAAAAGAELQRREAANRQGSYSSRLAQLEFVPAPKRAPRKCESCGSREFVEHHGHTICSYCRSAP